jgi:hypothetical protein
MMAYVGVMQRNDVLSGITIFAVLHSHAPPPSRCPEFFTSATPFQGKCPMHHSCILQVWPCEAVPSVPGSPTRSHVLQPSSQHFLQSAIILKHLCRQKTISLWVQKK